MIHLGCAHMEQYQKDPKFPPDKADQWSVEEDSWILSHNSLRGEVQEMDRCLRRLEATTPWQAWQIACLQKVWKYHATHVHLHHLSEEQILQPFLEQRFAYPETASAGHEELTHALAIVSEKVAQLPPGDSSLTPLSQAFDHYRNILVDHLQEEETVVLPLIRAYFTQQEFKATGKALGQQGGHVGSFVYYIGEDKFRQELMPRWKMPFFVWYLAFAGPYHEYQRDVIRQVEALEANTPPTEETGPSCRIS